jgi:hypothetical protein
LINAHPADGIAQHCRLVDNPEHRDVGFAPDFEAADAVQPITRAGLIAASDDLSRFKPKAGTW